MTEKSSFDPVIAVRDWFTQWEKIAREQGGQIFAEPGVKQSAAAAGAVASEAETRMREAAGGWLAAMNLPSRGDVEALGQALRGVEERLARIEAALGAGPAAPEPPPPPKRGRKPKA